MDSPWYYVENSWRRISYLSYVNSFSGSVQPGNGQLIRSLHDIEVACSCPNSQAATSKQANATMDRHRAVQSKLKVQVQIIKRAVVHMCIVAASTYTPHLQLCTNDRVPGGPQFACLLLGRLAQLARARSYRPATLAACDGPSVHACALWYAGAVSARDSPGRHAHESLSSYLLESTPPA